MTDKPKTCAKCACSFIFTVKEQAHYKKEGLREEPKLCRDCRRRRRVAVGKAAACIYDAFCAQCGQACRSPFPVLPGRLFFCDTHH